MRKNSRVKVQKKRSYKLLISVAFLCLVLGGVSKLEKIQGGLGHFFSFFHYSEENIDHKNDLRGSIYDRNFKPLAVSLERVSVYAMVREIKDINETVSKLAPVLHITAEELDRLVNGSSQRVWLAKDINQDVEEHIKKLDLPGIHLHSESSRYYPEHATLSHLLGFSEDRIGLAGIEYKYDQLLSKLAVSSRDDGVFVTSAQAIQLSAGRKDLVLTVDLKIQKIVEEFVDEVGRIRPGLRVGACMLEGKTGAIIGSANFPDYDPNNFRDYTTSILDNVLLEPVVIPLKLRAVFRDAVQLSVAGNSDKHVLPWSVMAPQVDLGAEIRMWQKTGIEAGANELDFAADSMQKGQYLRVTDKQDAADVGTVPVFASPVQMVTAFASLLNGGRRITPHAMEKLYDPVKKKPLPLNDNGDGSYVVDPEASEEISRLIEAQAIKGELDGGYFVSQSNQYIEKDRGKEYAETQIVMAPIPFYAPDVVFLLVIKQQGFGPMQNKANLVSSKLVESMNDLLPSLTALQQVMKNLSDMMQMAATEEKNFSIEGLEQPEIVPAGLQHQERFVMPDLVGQSLRKSLRRLDGKKLTIKVAGSGLVVEQDPVPGTVMENGASCTVWLKEKD